MINAELIYGFFIQPDATESQFAEFVQGRGDIICKPIDGSSGQGICKCTPEDYKDVKALYERLKAAGIGIVEDKVIQHEAIAALCPTSVNTIRVATLLGEKRGHCLRLYPHRQRQGDG